MVTTYRPCEGLETEPRLMGQKGYEKTQEDILRERAEILFRAGEKLSDALRELTAIELNIEHLKRRIADSEEMTAIAAQTGLQRAINIEIDKFNSAREYAKLRYYYLIVTREAMGFTRHAWIDEIYRIPGKKRTLRETDGPLQEPKN